MADASIPTPTETAQPTDILPITPTPMYPNEENTTWRLFGFHDNDLKLNSHYMLHSKIDGHLFTTDERFAAALWTLNHRFRRSRTVERKLCPGAMLWEVFRIRHQCKRAYLDPDVVKRDGSGLNADA